MKTHDLEATATAAGCTGLSWLTRWTVTLRTVSPSRWEKTPASLATVDNAAAPRLSSRSAGQYKTAIPCR